MDLDSIKVTYFAECSEQLAELETGLFSLANDQPDPEIVNSVFRAVHSIKGGAGAFALDDIVSFAHVLENALDVLRNDISQCNEARLELLLRSSDLLSDIVNAARDSSDPVDYSELAGRLESEFELGSESDEENVEFDAVPISLDDLALSPGPTGTLYQVEFAALADLYLHGHDTQRIFRELRQLGSVSVICETDSVPSLEEFDPKSVNLSWKLEIQSEKSIDELQGAFDWVEHLCELKVNASESAGEPVEIDITEFLGESETVLVDQGADVGTNVAGSDSETEVVGFGETENLEAGDAAVASNHVGNNESTAALETKANVKAANGNGKPVKPESNSPQRVSKTIRADSEKVDRLINLMGELVISQSMLSVQIAEAGVGNGSPTALALVALQNLTREIQSSVMAIRAQPVKPVFMRMSRVVREVCGSTGKKAQLVLEGEQTEVDTTVIEGLSDPLTHMIRNSVDHGIESPEARTELGKLEQGQIKLSAFHSSGNIVIQITDDGAGINRDKVFQKAVENGIVGPDAKLSDDDIDNLIFAPGFSTADTVTDVSGRGVGMDVVRQSIQQLGGRVSISSEPGKGSQFTLNLPLTLAILDGMLVQEAEQMFVVPVSSVVETMSLRPSDVFEIGGGHLVLKLRDQLLPIVDVGHELGFSPRREDYTDETVLVVESGKNAVSAFVVSSIEGQQQVVIKSMESNYQRIPCISAATILGNGRIALILDVDEIVTRKVRETPPQQVLDQTG